MVADFLHNRGEPQTSFYPNFGQTEPEPESEQRLAETLSLLWLIENVTSVIVIDRNARKTPKRKEKWDLTEKKKFSG